MGKNVSLVVVLFLALHLQLLHAHECPPSWDPEPCSCAEGSVTCDDTSNITSTEDLEKIFNSPFVDTITHLKDLLIRDVELENITGSGVFGYFAFEKIKFHTTKTKSISDDAFKGQDFLKILKFVKNEFETFNYNCLNELKLNIFKIKNNPITEIPSNSIANFSAKIIHLTNNELITVKSRAFADISDVRKIFLSRNRISTLENRAFNLLNLEKTVEIYLNSNNLTSKGIHKNAFPAGIKLKMLILSHNHMTSFPRNIFEPVLDAMTRIKGSALDVTGNLFVCDKSLTWLVKKPKYKSIVRGMICKDGKVLNKLNLNDVLN